MDRVTTIILGTGTSTGIPVPGCNCKVCTSNDPRNNRTRAQAYVELRHEGKATTSILIDTATDLRTQLLRENISKVDAVLYTHAHADHVNGIDDLRSFNFTLKKEIPIYATSTTLEALKSTFRYAFFTDPNYEGGAPPKLNPIEISSSKTFEINGFKIEPLQLWHGSTEVLGFRFGNFAYCTDCNQIPAQTIEKLKGVEVLILDGLRDRPHPTHFTQSEAVKIIETIKPKKAYLTHISHEIDHSEANRKITTWTNHHIELAYDGQLISL